MTRSWYYDNHVKSKLNKIIEIQLLNSPLPKDGLELKKNNPRKVMKKYSSSRSWDRDNFVYEKAKRKNVWKSAPIKSKCWMINYFFLRT